MFKKLLRDYFAAKAMQTFMITFFKKNHPDKMLMDDSIQDEEDKYCKNNKYNEKDRFEILANFAYAQADAMMERRKSKKNIYATK